MSPFLAWVLLVAAAILGSTVLYHLAPYRTWTAQRPRFVVFPEYRARFESSAEDLEQRLIGLGFERSASRTYRRGKIWGDFSARAILLSVVIDATAGEIRVRAPVLGVLCDTGDLWQLTAELVAPPVPAADERMSQRA